jgi:hypothetical protein
MTSQISFKRRAMNRDLCTKPTDADVRRLLHAAGMSRDPRSFVAVALLLSEMLPVGRMNLLKWENWDRVGRTLIVCAGHGRYRAISLTNLVARQLALIPRLGDPLIFAPATQAAPKLAILFQQILANANLSAYKPADFIGWSERQSAATRHSTATA